MKHFKNVLTVLTIVVSGFFTTVTAYADSGLPTVKGQIRDVTIDIGEITIKHAPIPNLDMMGMTMVFQAEEGVNISKLNKGDKVDFTVMEKDGKYMLQSIVKSE